MFSHLRQAQHTAGLATEVTPEEGARGTRTSGLRALLVGFAALSLGSLCGGCLSNPTPHPEQHDGLCHELDVVNAAPDDQGRDKDDGTGTAETLTGNCDGADADATMGDADPSASVDEDGYGDATGSGEVEGDGYGDDGGGTGEYDNDDEGDGDDAGPTEPSDDFSSCGGGGRPPTNTP